MGVGGGLAATVATSGVLAAIKPKRVWYKPTTWFENDKKFSLNEPSSWLGSTVGKLIGGAAALTAGAGALYYGYKKFTGPKTIAVDKNANMSDEPEEPTVVERTTESEDNEVETEPKDNRRGLTVLLLAFIAILAGWGLY